MPHLQDDAASRQPHSLPLTQGQLASLPFLEGIRWDAVPVDSVGIDDLDHESLEIFRREAVKNAERQKSLYDSMPELLAPLLNPGSCSGTWRFLTATGGSGVPQSCSSTRLLPASSPAPASNSASPAPAQGCSIRT